MNHLTYHCLFEKVEQQTQAQSIKPQTASNRTTSLRSFLKVNSLSSADVVGQEMRAKFNLAARKLADAQRADGKSAKAITNTLSMLRRFREMVAEDDRVRAASDESGSPFQKAVRSLMTDHPVKRVARETNIPVDMLYGWIAGKRPRPSNAKYIHRLEAFFGVESGNLALLAGIRGGKRLEQTIGVAPRNEYRERLLGLTETHFYLKVSPESPLREQWSHLMVFKTSKIPQLKRSPAGRWTVAPIDVLQPNEATWYRFHLGKEVPSAYATWSHVGAYLGWMTLSQAVGGLEMPEDTLQTLAWLAVPDHVDQFIEWRNARAGGSVSRGIMVFLGTLIWMTHPEHGYLTQQPQFQATLPARYQQEDWKALCERQHQYCLQLKAVYAPEVRASRDPFLPLRPILDLPQPMDAIADMVQRMRADRPTGGSAMREAVWARNMVIIKLLASNPLRIRNFMGLRWVPEYAEGNHSLTDCCLYQRADRSWWIFVPKQLLKNRRRKLMDDYDAPVHESVWPDLERYLFQHRPVLMRHPTDLVLLRYSVENDVVHKPVWWAGANGQDVDEEVSGEKRWHRTARLPASGGNGDSQDPGRVDEGGGTRAERQGVDGGGALLRHAQR